MTHLKSTTQRKRFVIAKVKRASPKKVYKIYRATEKAIGYKHKKQRRTMRRRR